MARLPGEPAERIRVGVVGLGLVAQAVHLPNLRRLSDRFDLAAVADPSPAVRDALAERYGALAYAGHDRLLAEARVDAIVICSPNGTHVGATLDALDAGCHVFVEKPLCIAVEDADAIVARRDAAARVVQVGYQKRFDPAVERLLEELPSTADALAYVSVEVSDPEAVPYFAPDELVRGAVPDAILTAGRASEAAQVERAVGRGDPEAVRAFSDGYLGSLVHQVNLVHGALAAMGEPVPAHVVDADVWDAGRCLTGALRLRSGARWDNTWLQLLEHSDYAERIAFYFADGVRELRCASPWLDRTPTRYVRTQGRTRDERRFPGVAYRRELEHFHDCIRGAAACATPPEAARDDLVALTAMFGRATAAIDDREVDAA